MAVEKMHLKERFPALGEKGADPFICVYTCQPLIHHTDRPVVLLCPGGGYRAISEREGEPVALRLLSWGYQVCVLSYSVEGYPFPAQLREVAAAMELLWENAGRWHIDRERIAIMGFSAGGHLAAHYTNQYDCPQVRQLFPDSKPVQASVLCYPVITAQEQYCHKGSFQQLTGHEYPLSREELSSLSCEQMVSERTPPTFLWHTRTDDTVPVINSLLYSKALAENGVSFSMHIYPEGPHGLATADEQTNRQLTSESRLAAQWMTELRHWLAITL